MIDRQLFFAGVRRSLIGTLSQSQVDGLNFLLDQFEANSDLWFRTGHIAYALATTMHETAASFEPVEEGYYLGRGAKAFQKTLRYYPWFGRGYVQLTWQEGYQKASIKLRSLMPELVRQFEAKTGQTFSLLNIPDQALDPFISFGIMTLGMIQGWFRAGHTLERYINDDGTNYYLAREIINGDKAMFQKHATISIGRTIERYAKTFEAILRTSRTDIPAINSADEFAKTSGEDVFPASPVMPEPLPVPNVPDSTQNAGTDAASANQAASDPTSAPVDMPAGSQSAPTDVLTTNPVNATATTIDAAGKLPDAEIDPKANTGFLAKITGTITAIVTGKYILPEFLNNNLNQLNLLDIFSKVASGLWNLRYFVFGSLALWYVVTQFKDLWLKHQAAQINTDPTKGNVVLPTSSRVGIWQWIKGKF